MIPFSAPRLMAAAMFLAAPTAYAQAPEHFDIAITVDDVPLHGMLPPG